MGELTLKDNFFTLEKHGPGITFPSFFKWCLMRFNYDCFRPDLYTLDQDARGMIGQDLFLFGTARKSFLIDTPIWLPIRRTYLVYQGQENTYVHLQLMMYDKKGIYQELIMSWGYKDCDTDQDHLTTFLNYINKAYNYDVKTNVTEHIG